jgi:DmsE family decaheme c-type cytochrome
VQRRRTIKLLGVCLAAAFAAIASVRGAQQPAQTPQQPAQPVAPTGPNFAVGAEVCGRCHVDKLHQFRQTPHSVLVTDPDPETTTHGCESCHGPGGHHVQTAGDPSYIFNPRKATAEEVAARCTACHVEQSTRKREHHAEHDPDAVGCNDCHSPHQEKTNPYILIDEPPALCFRCHKEVESEFHRPFRHRVLEGGMSCLDCHSAHGERNTAEARKSAEGMSGLCASCHADKHGPFVFEHLAISRSADGCVTCHMPHGSVNNRMLVRNTVFQLCVQCHSEIGLSADPAGGVFPHDLSNPRISECVVCHTQIHGSNSSRTFLN